MGRVTTEFEQAHEGQSAFEKACFPLRNTTGQLISFYGRSLLKGPYYQSGRCGLFSSYPSKICKKLIVTESVIDAANLLEVEALKKNEVLALFGTNGFTGEQERALLSCEELEEAVLLLDGDEAGSAA